MYANSVQVFKTNTMHLQVDKNTKLEKLFVGTMEEYTKRQKEILSSQTIKNAVGESALTLFKTNASNLGEIAKSGMIDNSLLNELNNLEFYKTKKQKSLGKEWVVEKIFPLLNLS